MTQAQTISLELDEEQAALLKEMLQGDISELGGEIAATERLAFRDQLKRRRALISQIADKLESTTREAA